MFDQSQVQELLDAAKPAVIEQLKRDLTQQLTYDVRETAHKIVRETVETWVRENMVPTIVAQLVESKDGLAAIGAQLGPAIVTAVVDEMTKGVVKNLSQSWTRKKIFDALID